MKKVFVDTDVCLDLLSGREPFVLDASRLFDRLFKEGEKSFVSAFTFVTLHYFLKKKKISEAETRATLERFKAKVEILPVTEKTIAKALLSGVPDFEDAVQIQAAELARMDLIITRNTKDYKKAGVKVLTPAQFMASLRPPFST